VADIAGVVSFTDGMKPSEVVGYAERLESLGYEELWLPDLFGRELFVTASFLLSQTRRIRVATGIANVYARDPMATAQAARTLGELYDGRFILGLGVSHPHAAEARGHTWIPPVRKLREHLEGMRGAPLRDPGAEARAPVYIAAHGPKLLALAAELADGANTYLMPPDHTREARGILGPDKTLNVVLPCCLCGDLDRARQTASRGLAMYLELDAYRRQWRRFGFGSADFEGGGSQRLLDGLVAHGDESALRSRIADHLAAGASRILLVSHNPEGRGPHWKLLEALSPGA
jgi:probable F420-dependent oxidoreductase